MGKQGKFRVIALLSLTVCLMTGCVPQAPFTTRDLCYFKDGREIGCEEVSTKAFMLPVGGHEPIAVFEGSNVVCLDLNTGIIESSDSSDYSCKDSYVHKDPDPEGDGIVGDVIGIYDETGIGLDGWRAVVSGPGSPLAGRSLAEYSVQMSDGSSQPIDVVFIIDSYWTMFDAHGEWYSWQECALAAPGNVTSEENLILNEYGRTSWQQDCLNQRGWKIICEDSPADPVCANLIDYSWTYGRK